jgi:hypothetical protein
MTFKNAVLDSFSKTIKYGGRECLTKKVHGPEFNPQNHQKHLNRSNTIWCPEID